MKLFPIIFLFLCFTTTVRADDRNHDLQLRDLKKSQVLELLGPPNRSSSVPSLNDLPSSETLYYGSSQLTLINNKVSSVFDLGEIKEILMKTKRPMSVSKKSTWPNPWTPPNAAKY